MPRVGFGGGFTIRRFGSPLIGMRTGTGSPLMTGMMAGGIGYVLGSNNSNQQAPPVQQVTPLGISQMAPAPISGADSVILPQIKLPGE